MQRGGIVAAAAPAFKRPENPRLSAFKLCFLVFQTIAASRFSSAFVLPPSPKRSSRNLVKSAPGRAFGEIKRSIADFGAPDFGCSLSAKR
jgi:hypothetical protein